MSDHDWLSPTSAWRLLQCPAAVRPGGGQKPADSGWAQNAGSIAHLAVRMWIESGVWQADDDGGPLREAFDEAAAAAGTHPSLLYQGVLTRARLAQAAHGLRSALGGGARDDSTISCETELRDEERRLHGIPDLQVSGAASVVIDLKTGRESGELLPERIRFQLLIYAHLFRIKHGMLPERAEVFSLVHGRLQVPMDEGSLTAVLASVEQARGAIGMPARPALEACRFCPRRLACDEHWHADEEVRPDGLEGEVGKLRTAETGTVALKLRTASGSAWVTQIPANKVGGISVGSQLRLTGLFQPRSASDWRATGRTQVRLL